MMNITQNAQYCTVYYFLKTQWIERLIDFSNYCEYVSKRKALLLKQIGLINIKIKLAGITLIAPGFSIH